MAKVPLESSVLKSVEYDGAAAILTLEFHSGKTYQYAEVPLGAYQGLLLAKSPGKFYGEHIRRQYRAPEE
jgi:KTSC domain